MATINQTATKRALSAFQEQQFQQFDSKDVKHDTRQANSIHI
jgi:hypothetical protein